MARSKSAPARPTESKTRVRRSEEQLIADLQAKIETLKAKAAAKAVKKDPAAKHTTDAVRAIDQALANASSSTQRGALSEARSVLVAYLQLEGVKIPQKRGRKPGWRKPGANDEDVAATG